MAGMTDIQFGVDLSHHKPGFDLARAAREGVSFVILKATDGADFVDSTFAGYLAGARAAGLLVAAYHYVRSNATAAAQVALVLRTVPADVPLAVDVEANSGGPALTRDVVARLQAAGRRVVWTYLPRWYWQQLGSPALAGLPPLWSSRYPDTVVGSIGSEFAAVPASYWTGYGGLNVSLLQFTSSAAISNYTAGSIDANAFRGTRTQLAAVLGGTTQEDDMPLSQDDLNKIADTVVDAVKFRVLAGDWRPADGRNPIDMLKQTVDTTFELADRPAVVLDAATAAAIAAQVVEALKTNNATAITASDVEAAMRRVLTNGVGKSL